jgi:N utilization substance protein B
MGGQNLSAIEAQFREEQDMARVDGDYFHELLHRIPAQVSDLDDRIAAALSRPIAQVDPVERTALRIGTYELVQRPELPWRVVINEAVELAKTFGGDQGHRFVNAALDRIAADVRAVEIAAAGGGDRSPA